MSSRKGCKKEADILDVQGVKEPDLCGVVLQCRKFDPVVYATTTRNLLLIPSDESGYWGHSGAASRTCLVVGGLDSGVR